MSNTSNSQLVDNHDQREDSPSSILDMSLEDILRLELAIPFEDSDDDLFRDDAVDNEIGSGSSVDDPFVDGVVSNNDQADKENVSAKDEGDNEVVSQNEDQHQYATRAQIQRLTDYLEEFRCKINDKFDYLFDREADQRQQLEQHKDVITAQQREIQQYKKVLAEHQQLMNKQADLIAEQAEQICELEKRLSES